MRVRKIILRSESTTEVDRTTAEFRVASRLFTAPRNTILKRLMLPSVRQFYNTKIFISML